MTTPGTRVRPAWKAGEGLTAGALCLDQRYRFQLRRRHQRLVHGWGVVYGLTLVEADDGVTSGPDRLPVLRHRALRRRDPP
jgi:hypothetical protein